jgi:hypothetical protein
LRALRWGFQEQVCVRREHLPRRFWSDYRAKQKPQDTPCGFFNSLRMET